MDLLIERFRLSLPTKLRGCRSLDGVPQGRSSSWTQFFVGSFAFMATWPIATLPSLLLLSTKVEYTYIALPDILATHLGLITAIAA